MPDKVRHADRPWCVLTEGHDGQCLNDWEKRHFDKQRMLKNWRGRRYTVCTAIGEVEAVIRNLGVEDGSQLPRPEGKFQPKPDPALIAEVQNMAALLLRMILVLNDGSVSPSKLNGF